MFLFVFAVLVTQLHGCCGCKSDVASESPNAVERAKGYLQSFASQEHDLEPSDCFEQLTKGGKKRIQAWVDTVEDAKKGEPAELPLLHTTHFRQDDVNALPGMVPEPLEEVSSQVSRAPTEVAYEANETKTYKLLLGLALYSRQPPGASLGR